MSEHAPDRVWSGIDIPKTIAGVLAAVSAAVVGSFLGVAGTLAGAALASIVGSVGTEIYRKLVARGHKKIVATFVTAPAAVGTPAVVAAEDEAPSEETAAPTPPRKMRWGRVAMVAAGVFVLAIGVLTTFELITGKTAADAVAGRSGGSSPSIVRLLDPKSNDTKVTTPTTPPSSGTPSEAPTTSGDSGGTTTTDPTGPATTTPSAPSTQTATPEPTATDTQNSDSGGGGAQNDIAPPPTAQPQGTE